MGVPTLTGLGPDPSYEDVVVKINSLVNELRNALLTLDTVNVLELNAEVITAGSITADKIGANEITADKMNVNQLSAISANLGHITAGTIEAVQIFGSVITGSLIQTNTPGNYPRIELSSDSTILKAEGSINNVLQILSSGGIPRIHMSDFNTEATVINQASGALNISTTQNMNINAIAGVVNIQGVDIISALNNKAPAFSGVTGGVGVMSAAGNPIQLLFNNGIYMGAI